MRVADELILVLLWRRFPCDGLVVVDVWDVRLVVGAFDVRSPGPDEF